VLDGVLARTAARCRGYAREKQFEGDRVKLADGSQWIVPRIREFREIDQESPFSVRYCLPRSLTYDPEAGTFTPGDVVPQYRLIADEAVAIGEAVHCQLIGSGTAALDQARIDRFAGGVLRLNYRVDVPELGLLQLLDETTLTQVVRAALHLDWFEAALKKRLASRHFGTSNMNAGESPSTEAASTPTPHHRRAFSLAPRPLSDASPAAACALTYPRPENRVRKIPPMTGLRPADAPGARKDPRPARGGRRVRDSAGRVTDRIEC
jgi:hypothetical protein